jgi:hypothetical protein
MKKRQSGWCSGGNRRLQFVAEKWAGNAATPLASYNCVTGPDKYAIAAAGFVYQWGHDDAAADGFTRSPVHS